MEEMMMMESGGAGSRPPCTAERKGRPPPQEQLNCPRCKSSNTKFCYYNNYSLTQPRYFCKSCRRYWTEGGSLRNVPVGGGSRKNRKSTSVTTAMTTNKVAQPPSSAELAFQPHDLNLAFPAATTAAGHFETLENHHHHHHHHDRHTVGLGSYIPNLMPYSGSQHELSDSVSEIKFGMGVEESNINNGGRFAFSFADQSKQHQHQHQQQQQHLFSSSNGADLMNSKGQESSSGYWNGMLGGGGGPW